MNLSKLLSVLSAVAISALLGTAAFAQDRPDLMDLYVDDSGTGGSAPLVDNGKGKPLSGARNRIESGTLDNDTTNYVSGILTGTVPVTAEGGTQVRLWWSTNEPDRVQRASKSAKVDQKAYLAFFAGIYTAGGYTAYSNPAYSVYNFFDWGYNAVEDCSAKFSAKGTPTALLADAPHPTKAKWSAKCKQSSLASILTALGVGSAQQGTIAVGLGIDPTDKLSVKGGF